MAQRKDSFQRGIATGTASFLVVGVLLFVFAVVSARLYGAAVVGAYAIAYAPTGVLTVMSSVREQAALMRELAVLDPRSPLGTALFLVTLGFSTALTLVVGAVVITVGAITLARHLNDAALVWPTVVLAVAYLVFQNPSWNIDSLLSSQRASAPLFWSRLNSALSMLVLTVAFYFIDTGVWSLVAAFAISNLSGLAQRLFYLRRFTTPRLSRQDFRDARQRLIAMLRWSIKLAPGGLLDGLGSQIATWILAYQMPVAAVGSYSRAWALASRMFELTYRLNEITFPMVVERRSEGDAEGASRALEQAVRLGLAATLLPAAVVGGASVSVMNLFGADFLPASGALSYLLVVPALLTVTTLQFDALLAVGHTHVTNVLILLRTVLIVVGLVVWTEAFGITGAGFAIALAYLVTLVGTTLVLKRHEPEFIRPQRIRAVRLAVAYAITFCVARGCTGLLGHSIGSLAVSLLSGTAVYCAVLLATRWLHREELSAILSLRRRFARGGVRTG
jgi:O-antigen/teichoic acid export membrane protein